MALPMFNPEGTGPQGANGIPPEEFQKGLDPAESALVNAGMTAENSPGSNRVMDSEVTSIMKELGLNVNSSVAPAAPLPNTPAEEPSSQPAAALQQAIPQGIDPTKLQGIIDKYQGDISKMAAAYLSTDQARAQTQQRSAESERQYVEEIQRLGGQIQTMQQQFQDFMASGGAQGPQEQITQPVTPQATDFWTNPNEAISRIVQDNLLAYERANQDRERQREFEKKHLEKAADIERLRPQMRELYRKHPVLQQLPPDAALDLLLETASAKEEYNRAGQFFAELKAMGLSPNGGAVPGAIQGQSNGGAVTVAPGAGGMSGGVGVRAVTVPGAPANGDWSKTPAFNALMRSREGGTDEMGALTRLLDERGFYNNR